MENLSNKTVGEIVALNIEYANIFQSYGIDFCCGGNKPLKDAAGAAGVPVEKILDDLNGGTTVQSSLPQALNFDKWSLDLLIDYVTKFHHHYIRTNGPKIYSMLVKVIERHGESDPHLYEVRDMFEASLTDLGCHLEKEENILFPLIREIETTAKRGGTLESFHCGSVQNPIYVMMRDHDDEGDRFKRISSLTNAYQAPIHACNTYKIVLNELKQFEENLHIHIHVENNIIFPKAIKLESITPTER